MDEEALVGDLDLGAVAEEQFAAFVEMELGRGVGVDFADLKGLMFHSGGSPLFRGRELGAFLGSGPLSWALPSIIAWKSPFCKQFFWAKKYFSYG